FQDNLMKMHGNQEFNLGFNFNHVRGDILQPSSARGVFTYNGQYSDIPNKSSGINGMSDMLITPTASSISPSPGVTPINNLGSLSNFYGSNYAKTYYFGDYY